MQNAASDVNASVEVTQRELLTLLVCGRQMELGHCCQIDDLQTRVVLNFTNRRVMSQTNLPFRENLHPSHQQ